ATAHGRPEDAGQLSVLLFRYLDGGYYTDALAIHGHAHRAAEQRGDAAGTAHALFALGVTHFGLSAYRSASDHFTRARDLCHRIGDHLGEARARFGLGTVEVCLGRYSV